MSFNKAVAFCNENYDEFIALANLENKKIVLLPEFTQIKALIGIFENSKISIGAQDCSVNDLGPYTGQVSVESLAQIGCSYCIIEHSEMREFRVDSPQEVAVKILRLDQVGITPIFCIGEHLQDINCEISIKEQLEPVFELIAGYFNGDLIIAYEPVFSIGTGIVPEVSHINKIFDLIIKTSKKFNVFHKIKLFYGGSVDEKNAKELKNIENLNGFLLGGASLDFKKFKKIVEL